MNKCPDHLFLPPEAFDGFNKYMNIYGKEHVCAGDPYVEFARLEAVQAHPAKFGVEIDAFGLTIADWNNFHRHCRKKLEARIAELEGPESVFASDGNEEACWIEHELNACPACGGSGHRDDVKPACHNDNPYLSGILLRAFRAADKAKLKHPQPNKTLLKVAEEAGEVVRAGVHYSENRMEWSEVEAESVQAIAMIFRLLTEGDEINGVIPPHLKKPTNQREVG